MGSVYLQIFWLILWVNLFIGIERSDAATGDVALLVDSKGKFKVSQISASGITDTNVLERLQYNCCTSATGTASGLCLSPTGKPTIEIDFGHETKVDQLKIQTPVDISVGYIKTFKVMYTKTKADTNFTDIPKANFIYAIFHNDPRFSNTELPITLDSSKEIIAQKLIVQIESFGGTQPCLRMEVMGCPEKNCPVMWDPPTVDAVDTRKGDNTVEFQCSVNGRDRRLDDSPRVFHKATWIHDGKPLNTIDNAETDQIIISRLHQKDLYEYLPHSVNRIFNNTGGFKCSVIACGESGCSGWRSRPMESNELLPTATFDLGANKTSVTIQEGMGGVDISLTLNGPPVLFLTNDIITAANGTNVVVEARFNQRTVHPCGTAPTDIDIVVIEDTCGRDISSRNWNASQKLTLKAVTDGLYREQVVTRKCDIILKHLDNTRGTILERKFTKIPFDVHVKVADGWTTPVKTRPGSVCYVVNDPHFKTFDHFHYDAHVTGEFIVYRNRKYNYQVNAIFRWCGRAACICGVAVKAGDDVVVMSSCPTTTNTNNYFKIYLWQNGNLTSGLKIYRGENQYFVYLPTGTYVTVWSGSWYVNLHIEPSLADLYQTEGLCGDYNGKKAGDLRNKNGSLFTKVKIDYDSRGNMYILEDGIHEYGEEWREDILPCKSIFFGVEADQNAVPVKTYCTCVLGSHSYDCGEHKDFVPCVPKGVIDVTPQDGTTGPNNKITVKTPDLSACPGSTQPTTRRKKRSATYTPPVKEDDEYQSFVFNKSFVPKTSSWPTASGWNEATARKYCEDFLLTKEATKNCKAFMGNTFEREINSCVFDIKASDTTDFAKSTLKNIISQCFSEAQKYPATVTELAGGVKKAILYESLCLDNCTNNGVCKDARCVCNPGYYGSTCSLTKDVPPSIVYMSRNGLCNTRTRDCTTSYIFGTGHIESTGLKCRMTPYDRRTGIRDVKGQFTSSAIYINFNMLACPHNEKNGTFLVAVSNNNGKDYSKDELLFLAYDSACHSCSSVDQEDKKAICTQETTGCAVGSACYLDGEVDEESICRICDTNRNIDNWSVNTAYSNCTKVPGDDIALIAGVTTAAVLVVAIIIIVVLTLKFCGRKKSVGPPSAADIQTEARASESTASETPENAERKLSSVSVNFITPALTP